MELPDKMTLHSKEFTSYSVNANTTLQEDYYSLNLPTSPENNNKVNWGQYRNNNNNNKREILKNMQCYVCAENHYARDCNYFKYEYISNNGDDQLKKRTVHAHLLYSQKQLEKHRKHLNFVPPPLPPSNSTNSVPQKDSLLDQEIVEMLRKGIYSIIHSSESNSNNENQNDDHDNNNTAPKTLDLSSRSVIYYKKNEITAPALELASNFYDYLSIILDYYCRV